MEAASAYRGVLAINARHGESLRLLGLIALQQGAAQEALNWLDLALGADPTSALAGGHRGDALAALGRLEEAIANYDRAIALDPCLREAHNGRGNALARLGLFDKALASYDRAIALDRGFVSAYSNRGNALKQLERFDEALASYDNAITLAPDFADAHNNRGNALVELGRVEAAAESFRKAIALKPQVASFHNNLGNVLHKFGAFEEAIECFDRAIAIAPMFAEPFNNRGNAHRELARFDDALLSFDRAIALEPANAVAYHNRAMCRLLVGQTEEGWRDYEWRPSVKALVTSANTVETPYWRGEDLTGRRILLLCEQGLGDAIQFIRYAPLMALRGCEVTVLAPERLLRLFRLSMRSVKFASTIEVHKKFDFQCALMRLPRLLGEFPAASMQNPYLMAEQHVVVKWRKRLGLKGFKIGIAWQGNPNANIDQGRSIPLAFFEGLSRIVDVRLISLQKGAGVEQLAQGFARNGVEALGGDADFDRDGFIDTAAVMDCLDLIITSDTSIAHLAGALGRPCWVALKLVPDWRWMLNRDDSPYYSCLRLFRQKTSGDWAAVFARIALAVEDFRRDKPTAQDLVDSLDISDMPQIPVSWGEIIDKITILEIKQRRLVSEEAVANVSMELQALNSRAKPALTSQVLIGRLKSDLKSVNERLWEIEDGLRRKEAEKSFDSEFIELARSVYLENDRRANLKREINALLNSALKEEKQYVSYDGGA
jgi:tetratricopeptide (TPR) repeat protein